MNKAVFIIAIIPACLCLFFCSKQKSDLKVVEYVDLKKYLGKWYEIARLPNSFQKDCVATTATYTLLENGNIEVLNACREKTVDGPEKSAKGKAWVADKKTNARLKVQFFWPFRGDYWIIDLGKNYEYAVVSEPGKEYLWILSRTPEMKQDLYDRLINRLKQKGFNLTKLIRTIHK